MKARPILFNTDMVKAILAGQKTQTRRPVPDWQLPKETQGPHDKFPDLRFMSVAQRHPRWGFGVFGETPEKCMDNYRDEFRSLCPFGRKRDLLYVRETFRLYDSSIECACYDHCECSRHNGKPMYFADGFSDGDELKWKPSIHMPRWASRLTLEITDVRVERLQEISEEDARAEGITDGGCLNCGESEPCGCDDPQPDARDAFIYLWDSIYGNWHANPWVWVVEFKAHHCNVDALLREREAA